MRTDREAGSGRGACPGRDGLSLRRSFRIPQSAFRTAFTLVELLVVIAIIAILAGLLMPAISSAMRKAHEGATLSMIHEIETGITGYFNDHGDYPPSEWNELDEAMRYDLNGDGTYSRADDEVWLADGSLTANAIAVGGFAPVPAPGDPNATNVGIEVLVACLASRNGGPYAELPGSELGNTNADTDTTGIARVTNWFLNSNELFEVVDWWGNPLVYFHNRHYTDHDGVLADLGGGVADYENPGAPAVPPRFVPYVGADGVTTYPCYARSDFSTKTGNYPKLDSFQLYSWGSDLYPGRGITTDSGNLIYPGWTAGRGTSPNDQLNGVVPGPGTFQWVAGDGNLCNWEE